MSFSTEFIEPQTFEKHYTNELYELVHSLSQQPGAKLSDHDLQRLMTIASKLYLGRSTLGRKLTPFSSHDEFTPTEVMALLSDILQFFRLEVFELSLWQAWSIKERVHGYVSPHRQ